MKSFLIMFYISLLVLLGLRVFADHDQIKAIGISQSLDIKESRHREDLLYQEVKNLDYLVDVLTQNYIQKT